MHYIEWFSGGIRIPGIKCITAVCGDFNLSLNTLLGITTTFCGILTASFEKCNNPCNVKKDEYVQVVPPSAKNFN